MAGDKFLIESELVILCEGLADVAFIERIIGLEADFPPWQIYHPKGLGSRDTFGMRIRALRGDARGFSRLKGILIVADTADDPGRTLRYIARQLQTVGLTLPERWNTVGRNAAGLPAVAALAIPDERTPGGLETLCLAQLYEQAPHLEACVEAFLSCGDVRALTWAAEKVGKARFQAAVAAFNEDDPSKSIRYLCESSSGLDFSSSIFDSVKRNLRVLCIELLSA